MNRNVTAAIIAIFLMCLLAGCVEEPASVVQPTPEVKPSEKPSQAENATTITVPSVASTASTDPKLALAASYDQKGFSVTANASQYNLPL
ncbi:hypothetical protein C5S39_08590, partial [Candidatus Methanophagaceae archaeon]